MNIIAFNVEEHVAVTEDGARWPIVALCDRRGLEVAELDEAVRGIACDGDTVLSFVLQHHDRRKMQ